MLKLKSVLISAAAVFLPLVLMTSCSDQPTENGDTSVTNSTTSFSERMSYYDSLADAGKVEEYQTTVNNAYFNIGGDIETLPDGVYNKLYDVCARCYTEICKKYYPVGQPKRLTVTIDGDYSRESANHVIGDVIMVNPYWFYDHPNDIDSIIPAMADIAITYHHSVPEWIKTSVITYIRNEFCVYDTQNDWRLPATYQGGKYSDGYETGAAFLKWIDEQTEDDFILMLNSEARKNQEFSKDTWKLLTGKTLNQLWGLYTGAINN